MNDRLRQPRDGIALGGFTVDLHQGELFDAAGGRVPLRRQSLAVLLQLARHAGTVLSRESLSQAVWQGLYVTDDSLVQCIVEIRRALGPEASAAIRTVPRRGYVLEPGATVARSGSGTPTGPSDGGKAAAHASAAPATNAALDGLVAQATPGAIAASGAVSLPFVGRQTDLDFLAAAVSSGQQRGRLVLISGEPGIGKSRLLDEAARIAAARGAATLPLKCHEIESGVPFGALSQVADRLLALLTDAQVRALDPTTRAELAALAPWCAARLEPLAPITPSDAPLRLARLRAALTTLCSAASAKQHLVLCIDDAHWLDEPTAVAAFTLAEAAASHAWTIWATMRQDEIARDPAAMRLVRALQELPHAHRLELERLPPQDVASIVEQVRAGNQGAALDVEQLVRESAGNPFYLRELLHARRSPYSRATAADAALAHQAVLPQGILEAVLHRARHLPAAALHLLEAAAVLEQPVPFDVLGAVAKQERHVALEALHLLLTTGWLAEDRERGRYPFVHDKLREAIYASLTAALCRTLHGRAARALLDDAARRRADPEHAVVATHAERSGHDVLAAEHYALAGDSARRLFELRRAEALYTQALDLGGRAGTGASPAAQLQWLEKRGAVRSMLGRAAEAEGDLRRAIAMARAGSPGLAEDGDPAADPAAHLRLHIELGVMLQRHNRLEDAIGALRRALDLGIASGDDGAIAAARCWLGDVQWMREHNREARMHFESLRAADGHNNPAVVAWATKALFGLAQCAGMDARPALADALLDQALARAQAPAEQFFQCAWAVLKGWIRVGPHGMGEPAAALEYFERCLRQSAETQLFWYEVPCRIGIGVVHMMQRRHDTAIEHFDAVLSLPADMNNGRWQLAAAVWLTSCHLERGDAEAALATARRAERHLAEFGPFMFAAKLPALVTIALSRLGRANECEDPQHLVDHARREELGYVLAAALEARAEWLHARRDRPALLDCAEELRREGQARGLPQVRSLGAFWRAKAMPIATAQPLELESARPAAWPPPHPMRRAST